jgi:cell division protein FtsW
MDRAPRRGADWHALTLVTLGLVAFGIVMVYSATSASAAVGGGDPVEYLTRQATFAVIGLLAMLGITRVDYRRLRLVAPALVVASLALCAAVLVLGAPVNGARRWLGFGPASFQPSELAKLALALWLAAHLAKRDPPRSLSELWRPIGVLVGLFAALILLEPDLGTTIAIGVMVAAVLIVSGTPALTLASAGAVAGAAAFVAVWIEPYRRARVFSFFNPWSDAQGAGFQTIQAQIGLGSGGLFGEGLGQGVQKIHYLPEAHTDMILAVIGEELGLLGTGAVILAYAAFAWAGLTVALRCRDPFGKRLAAGLTALVCGQAAVNLAAVLGLAPLTGIPLPFVSYGGSSLVVQLVAVGVLLNIAAGGRRRAQLRDRSRRDGGTRSAGARRRGRAAEPRRAGDLRGVAGPRRSAAGS